MITAFARFSYGVICSVVILLSYNYRFYIIDAADDHCSATSFSNLVDSRCLEDSRLIVADLYLKTNEVSVVTYDDVRYSCSAILSAMFLPEECVWHRRKVFSYALYEL